MYDVSLSHNAQRHRQTEGQTDDNIVPTVDHTIKKQAKREVTERERSGEQNAEWQNSLLFLYAPVIA